jgi:membrane associated rhomboid family serine protease
MSLVEVSPEPHRESLTEDLAAVGEFGSMSAGEERGLVVLAMGLPYWLVPEGDQFRLQVERTFAAEVGEQLTRYERESVRWPPEPLGPVGPRPDLAWGTPLLWGLSLLASYWAQSLRPSWPVLGALDPAAIFQRAEWWRPLTALFRHGDLGHLVSNAIVGVFVFSAVLATFGRGRGWLLLTVTAYTANAVSAALPHAGPYVAIGASTALFAGLGLLTGAAAVHVRAAPQFHRWRRVVVPLCAGFVLFALWGAGGPRVDFGAHVCGFAAGLIGGALRGLFLRPEGSAPDSATPPPNGSAR